MHKLKTIAFLGTALFAVFLLSKAAIANKYSCPASIVTHQTIQKTFHGWQSGQHSESHQLKHVSLYDGPPKDLASVKPNNEDSMSKHGYSEWDLSMKSENQKYWIECIYQNTTVRFSKQLPDSVSQCRVVFDSRLTVDGFPRVKSVVCE